MSAVGRRITRATLRKRWDYLQNALAWRTFYWNNRLFHSTIMRRMEQLARDADVVYVHCNPYLAGDVARIKPTVLRSPGPLTSDVAPVLERVHAVCANGDALKRIRGFLGERALELPIGVDQRRFSPGPSTVRSMIGWTSRHKVMGYVGRLSHIKGVDILAEGFRLAAREDGDIRLLIAGGGEEEPNLRATLKREIARGAVHFGGDVPHEKLPEWYRAMDVLVMPSRYENFSNAVVEGLACGVPFVGSDVGGNRLLSETGAGWLFEAGSAPSLAAALTAVFADAGDRLARGAKGRTHISSRYDWAASARRLEEILLPLLGEMPDHAQPMTVTPSPSQSRRLLAH